MKKSRQKSKKQLSKKTNQAQKKYFTKNEKVARWTVIISLSAMIILVIALISLLVIEIQHLQDWNRRLEISRRVQKGAWTPGIIPIP